MVTLLFEVTALLAVALVVYVIRACDTVIKFRKRSFVIAFSSIFLAHFALCLLDGYNAYAGWINLLFTAVIINFFWNAYHAKRNNYQLKMTPIHVVFVSIFAIVYILLGIFCMRYTGIMAISRYG